MSVDSPPPASGDAPDQPPATDPLVSAREGGTRFLEDYAPSPWRVEHMALTIRLKGPASEVESRMTIARNPEAGDAPTVLDLDGADLTTRWIRINGRPVPDSRIVRTPHGITLRDVPEAFTLTSLVRIDPDTNTRLEGLYCSGDLYLTQCEAEGFRRISWAIDRPDVPAPITTRIEADSARFPLLLGQGRQIDAGSLPGGRHFAEFEDRKPKPTYLFALVAGDLATLEDTITTREGQQVRLFIHAPPRDIEAVSWAMESLKRAIAWDETSYGRSLDLDSFHIVAAPDFNMGAMENTGLNIFNAAALLATPDRATDADYIRIESIVAHEFLHHWTGNRVTLRDWFQLSLKEGLTVFRDQQFSESGLMGPAGRLDQVEHLRRQQFAEDASPIAHPVRPEHYVAIDNFYTTTVYEKGAEIVRMIHTLLGPGRFRLGMDLYFERWTGRAATIEDWLGCMEEAGGLDLSGFRRWYAQAGTPKLSVRGTWLKDQQAFRLNFTQYTPPTPGQLRKDPVPIPVRLALFDENGQRLPVCLERSTGEGALERTILIDQIQQSVTFHEVSRPPMVSLLRGFSAPIRLDDGLTEDDLDFFLNHEDDPFRQREAARGLWLDAITALMDAWLAKQPLLIPGRSLHRMRELLNRARPEGADLLARLIALPGEVELAGERDPIHVDAIHAARQRFAEIIGLELRVDLLVVYQMCQPAGPYEVSRQAIGLRRLRAAVLDLLAGDRDEEIDQLARRLYDHADNLTDRMTAMRMLIGAGTGQAEDLIIDFHRRAAGDPLLLDKWFRVQALADHDGAFERICRLAQHPDFSLRNPNRVRALLGAFAENNPHQFHRRDGAGYALLAENVLMLDRLNPVLAARTVTAFGPWRHHEPTRRKLMEARLKAMQEEPGLSANLRETIDRLLAPPAVRRRRIEGVWGHGHEVDMIMSRGP